MRTVARKRVLLVLIAALAALAALPASSSASSNSEPLWIFIPVPPKTPFSPPVPAPYAYFYGPCGLAVDSNGNWYISDYYHRVIDVYSGTAAYPTKAPGYAEGATGYITQFSNDEPLDGPCGMALNSSNEVFVNNYHRNVVKFGTAFSAGTGQIIAGPGVDSTHTTGVDVDPVTGYVYVDHRTYIGVYEEDGTPVMKIGEHSIEDGYGVAVSRYPGTLGQVYVPDAANNKVKVFDPVVSTSTPIKEIDGTGVPTSSGKFNSLRDASIAIDRVSGEIYVADDLQPKYTERPNAIVDVFTAAGAYKGHLRINVTDAYPVGLAVDNSEQATQGRVYVTSGNTAQAGVYAYRPGAATTETPVPTAFGLSLATGGGGAGVVSSNMGADQCSPTSCGVECSQACETEILTGASVTLWAEPDRGSAFAGWSGACSGTDSECTVEVSEATSVRADFVQTGTSQPSTSAGQAPSSSSAASPAAAQSPKAAHRRHRARRHRHGRRHRHNHRNGERAKLLSNH